LKITPLYNEISATGPDHNKVFEMAVMIGEFEFALGQGKSKQEAEQNAALKALENWDELLKKNFR
jgi:ribonuclease-3